jgi:hypothetical protein
MSAERRKGNDPEYPGSPGAGFLYLPCHAFVTLAEHNTVSQKDLAPSIIYREPGQMPGFFVSAPFHTFFTTRGSGYTQPTDLAPTAESPLRAGFLLSGISSQLRVFLSQP